MVCRTRRDDSDMVRAGRDAHGQWYVGRGTGRGVWWCRESQCGDRLHAGQLARALRAAVNDGDVVKLRAVLEGRSSLPRTVVVEE